MKSIPLPVRVAAGLAATAVEQARTLPAKLAGLPVTVASQALQVSMRVQQQVTELAIRGDEVLSSLSQAEETPEWATFDEDLEDDDRTDSHRTDGDRTDDRARRSAFDRVTDDTDDDTDDTDPEGDPEGDTEAETATRSANGFPADDPWVAEQRALAEQTAAAERDLAAAENYDTLSLAQLRARLRRFTADELAELLDYERANANRPSFVGMLTRRIATVRDTGD
ncbi:lipid droplet-associated protein [Actinophytocola sediminis]